MSFGKFKTFMICLQVFTLCSCGETPIENPNEPQSTVPQEIIPKPQPLHVIPHKDVPEYNYFIFGTYAGMCYHNCASMFRYDLDSSGEQLLGDKSDSFFKDDTEINCTIPIRQPYHINAVDSLFAAIPEAILNATAGGRYGCPDCTDGGAVYFELCKNGKANKFYFDPYEESLPDDIKTFIQQITKLVNRIEY